MCYDRRVDQRSVLMDEQFHEGSEDFKTCIWGAPGVVVPCVDCDMTIANSYKKSNVDVRPCCEIGTDHRQSFVHVIPAVHVELT